MDSEDSESLGPVLDCKPTVTNGQKADTASPQLPLLSARAARAVTVGSDGISANSISVSL